MAKGNYVRRNGEVMTTFSVRMDLDYKEKFGKRCHEDGKTMSQVIMNLIDAYMEGKSCILDSFRKGKTFEAEGDVYVDYEWDDPTYDEEGQFIVTTVNNKVVDSVLIRK